MFGAKVQDMPPPGGYQPINFARVPAKKYFSGYSMILGYLGITTGSLYIYYLNYKAVEQEQVEMRSAKFAVAPLLLAERDRAYLKQLRRNRDEEAKLMANVEGWEVGKLYGEPIYKTVPQDQLINPSYYEYYVHAPEKAAKHRAELKQWL